MVETGGGFGGTKFLSANDETALANRDIDILLAHSRHLDLDNHRLRGFPDFAGQQCPLRRGRFVVRRSTCELGQAATAGNDSSPLRGDALPCAGEASLQVSP